MQVIMNSLLKGICPCKGGTPNKDIQVESSILVSALTAKVDQEDQDDEMGHWLGISYSW